MRLAMAMKGSRSPSVPTSSITTLSGGTGSGGTTAGATSDDAEALTETEGAGAAASRPTTVVARCGGDPSSRSPLTQASAPLSILL